METGGQAQSVKKVAAASFIGTTIEWYDFFLYGTAAALVFGELFFPEAEPLVGTLLAFSTYAVGFVARPIGGDVEDFRITPDGSRALYVADQEIDDLDELFSALTDGSAATVKLNAPLAADVPAPRDPSLPTSRRGNTCCR